MGRGSGGREWLADSIGRKAGGFTIFRLFSGAEFFFNLLYEMDHFDRQELALGPPPTSEGEKGYF